MIIRDHMRFGWATEPTERKRTYVQPNRFGFSGDPKPTERKRSHVQPDRFGFSEDDPEATKRKRTYVQPDRFGFSGDDPEPAWQLEPEKRMEIRVVDGRVEVVECE
jgi:hypothetical protein